MTKCLQIDFKPIKKDVPIDVGDVVVLSEDIDAEAFTVIEIDGTKAKIKNGDNLKVVDLSQLMHGTAAQREYFVRHFFKDMK